MIFIYLFCPIMLQSLKNILTADLLQATIEQNKKQKKNNLAKTKNFCKILLTRFYLFFMAYHTEKS